MNRQSILYLRCLSIAILCPFLGLSGLSAQLKVSDNHRYIIQADGTPFFWMGDTAWELFHRLTKEETDLYFKTRAAQGFNVIQAVAHDILHASRKLYNSISLSSCVPSGRIALYWLII